VRYRGVLEDPNELALTVSVGLPVCFALRRDGGGSSRWLLAAVTFVFVVLCVVFTGSRGGQLVIAAILLCYFVARRGARGAALAAVLALPALWYGGREGGGASTDQRIDLWRDSLVLFREHPVLGVGYGNIAKHATQTAHNAFLQAAAEGGFLSLLLFCGVMYAACKIPWTALKRYTDRDDPRRAWAMALLASLVGLAVGVFFLSFAYHMVLWLVIGLSGAFHNVLRRADKKYRLRWTMTDYVAIGGGAFGILVLIYLAVRIVG
jgi:O-antigen ligase